MGIIISSIFIINLMNIAIIRIVCHLSLTLWLSPSTTTSDSDYLRSFGSCCQFFFRSNIRVYYICMCEQCSLKLDLRFDKHDDGVRVIGTCFMLIHVHICYMHMSDQTNQTLCYYGHWTGHRSVDVHIYIKFALQETETLCLFSLQRACIFTS